jgi:restriction endonuclease Mrr
LGGVNQRLPQQIEADFPIYGFEMIGSRRNQKLGPKRWRFLGLLEYVRHYADRQIDVLKALRQVWLFEFRILNEPAEVPPEFDLSLSQHALVKSRESNETEASDREVSDEKTEFQRFSTSELEIVRRQFLDLSPEGFEHHLCTILTASGFEDVSVTRYSQDGGIDVNAAAGKLMWPIAGLHIQLQAKRWLHTVGRKDVAELRGSLKPYARGAVVTTSHFSRAAIQEAAEKGKNPIILVDGMALADIALSTGCV